MKPGFTSFVLFAEMRTGSNFLEANQNALPGVVSYGEVFNPHFIGKKDQTEMLGIDLIQREADPGVLLDRMRQQTQGLPGFRYFHDHDARVFDRVIADPAWAKIILTRNPVDSYVSWKIAQATGQWKLTNAKRLKTAKGRFDAEEFTRHLEQVQAFQMQLLRGLQISGQTAFYLDYDDLTSLTVINGLATFLGLNARLAALDDTLKKQNPDEIEGKLINPADLQDAVARLDRFNLSRTPNFEPRRPPAIPSFAAAEDAPLLFMPVRSAPDRQIRDWLSTLGHGGLIETFEQKSLRQWKRRYPGHRSFTVIRHPLLRAHVAFREVILAGKGAEHRAILIRAYKAELPPVGEDFASAAAHHAAFLVFLGYVRLNVAGQTGQRVNPHWASQTAILQGFAGFHPADAILREDRLAEGLAHLADEIGVQADPPAADRMAGDALAVIHSAELEKAASDAYPRDYMGFGFDLWKP